MLVKTNEDFECLGLIYGDGCLKRRVSFANTSPELVNKVFRFLLRLKVNIRKIRVSIQTYWNETNINDGLLQDYWINHLPGINYENFTKTKRKQRTSKNMRNRKVPTKEGLAEIAFYNKNLGNELNKIVSSLKNNNDTEHLLAFLRGVIAAEGSVKLSNYKALREIRISVLREEDQKFIRTVLKKLDIKPNNTRYKFYISITGFDRFKIFDKYNLCLLHPNKQEQFSIGYDNLRTKFSPLLGK